jgi:hypothetical protein
MLRNDMMLADNIDLMGYWARAESGSAQKLFPRLGPTLSVFQTFKPKP